MMAEPRSDIFVDIQGFQCSFAFFPKEMAIFDGNRIANYLFKAPFNKNMLSVDELKTVTYAENYHGLKWESGNLELCEINRIFKHVLELYQTPRIYVKGTQKANFLKKFLSEKIVINIPCDREPKLSTFKKIPECFFHKSVQAWHCAASNVKILYNYKDCH